MSIVAVVLSSKKARPDSLTVFENFFYSALCHTQKCFLVQVVKVKEKIVTIWSDANMS